MKILAFVPARGGSVGIKNKNLTNLAGKPLIQYTLDILKKLGKSIYPFVSTNDPKIANYCRKKGFGTTYRRPLVLSKSNSNVIDALIHGVEWLKNYKGLTFDTILILQPTSPIRQVLEIKKALKIFEKTKTSSMTSVIPMREHPFECIEIKNKKWKFLRKPKIKVFRRQQFKKNFYFIDGSFYIIRTHFMQKHKKLIEENKTKFFILNRNWPVDIDNKEDLYVAKSLIRAKIK
ncbi:acylneuraminate cytidylyltransferase family protein [bacterium]|nr:acylneuraminate cytidylyltransferase family protein [bacterium]